jgi:outer membrane protein OmpA-like peptidoglycan-associated protein
MRSTILALAASAMLSAGAAAQIQGTDTGSGVPLFGFPMQQDGSTKDNFQRLPFRDLVTEIRIDLAADTLFDFDHGEVRTSAREYMQQIANLIFDRSNGQVRIECRSDRTSDRGAPAASQKLAQRCALAIQDWLVKQEKLTRVRFTATGIAVQPAPPLNPNDPFAQAPPSRSGISIVFAKR